MIITCDVNNRPSIHNIQYNNNKQSSPICYIQNQLFGTIELVRLYVSEIHMTHFISMYRTLVSCGSFPLVKAGDNYSQNIKYYILLVCLISWICTGWLDGIAHCQSE